MTKSNNRPEFGLLIDYEYCTGCHACEVACAQEFRRPKGITKGIVVLEVEQNLSKKKAYLAYIPFPTEQCVLCEHLTTDGEKPACVKSCMANCIEYGRLEELAVELKTKPRMVLWAPRA
jgi:Fe-S-cluster-containing dehydrogenase component